MRKLLALLIAVAILLSLTACGNIGETQGGFDRGGESQIENQDSAGSNENNDTQKADQSRTWDLYNEIFSGPYTLKVETYIKDFENPDNKTVSSTTFTVVDGNKSYTEIVSATNPDNALIQLNMDGYRYSVNDQFKIITRSPIRKSDQATVMVMQEEEFYADLIGEPQIREIYGKKYECERFSALAETVTYCYDGDELKYIIGDNGGVDIIMGVLELKKGADSSYFELPEDYEKNYE